MRTIAREVFHVKDGLTGIADEPTSVRVELDFRPLPDDGSRAEQAPEEYF